MFLTSPPYDNLRTYKGYTFEFERLARELFRVLKDGGVGVWIVNDETIQNSETLTSAKQKIYFVEECGFNCLDTMIYASFPPYPQKRMYRQGFSYMFVLTKGRDYTFHSLNDRRCQNPGSWRKRHTKRQRDGSLYAYARPAAGVTTQRDNVWIIPNNHYASTPDKLAFAHPAIMPEKLAEDHILSWSNPNDLILDPMCGSGTTLKMAVKHGRRYIGMDIAEEYCQIARERVRRVEAQPPLLPPMSPQRSHDARNSLFRPEEPARPQ